MLIAADAGISMVVLVKLSEPALAVGLLRCAASNFSAHL